MRTQKIITIDSGVYGKLSQEETAIEFALRSDSALDIALSRKQIELGDEWYLMSIAPAGSYFPSGFFTTLWEYDDSDEPAALDSTDEAESQLGVYSDVAIMDEVSKYPEGFIKRFTGNEDADVAEDGDTSPHIQHGEAIRVNGVKFYLVGFTRDGSGSYISFLEESAMHLEEQEEGIRLHTNQQSYGVEMPGRQPWGREGARITYAPRGYRGR